MTVYVMRDCTVTVDVSRIEFFELVELYLGDGLEISDSDSAQSLFRSPKAELFTSVEMYFGDGLEMAGHLVVTLVERLYRAAVDSYHGLNMCDTHENSGISCSISCISYVGQCDLINTCFELP